MFRVLLIEDNPGDVLMIHEAMRAHRLRAQTTVACDDDEALELRV
jgi:CheY-like chemotaxis protein